MSLHLRKERLQNITATEMSAILGVNPYATASKVREGKLNPVKIESIHLRRGTLLEPAVLEALELDLGWKTERHTEGTLVNSTHRIAATPDAYTLGRKALIECKSIGYKTFDKWYVKPPVPYVVQANVQMFVTGLDLCYLAALEAGDPYDCTWRLVVWEIARNPALEAVMKEAVEDFWALFAQNKALRASEARRALVHNVLWKGVSLIHPTNLYKEDNDDRTFSDLLSVFK